jgi:NAD(P)-dependent dehydrogenase (short-subunit alcohol dehydrogenase family)
MTSQTVIITGASRGLGAAAAPIDGSMGANVMLNARSEDDLAGVAMDILAAGGEALPVAGDISHPRIARKLVEATLDEFGRIDAIINNAGTIDPIASIADGDMVAWRTNWRINVLGSVALTQAALPYLRVRRGRVINVSSGAAVKVIQGWAAYSVSKAALTHFTRMLAEEEKDITSIALRPGTVDTAMQRAIREDGARGMPPEEHARFVQYHEQRELLAPELPGRALAVLALHAPLEWSGEFIRWNDERVQELVKEHGRKANSD